MRALLASWVHDAVKLKSKLFSPSSAETTRVTSAARAAAAKSVSAARIAQDVFLKVTALKDVGATITQRSFFAQTQLLHLGLEALARDLELARGLGHVAAGRIQRALDQLALDAFRLRA